MHLCYVYNESFFRAAHIINVWPNINHCICTRATMCSKDVKQLQQTRFRKFIVIIETLMCDTTFLNIH